MSSAASTATNDSTCTVVDQIVNNQIPNSSCSNNVNSVGSHQPSHHHKQQPQTESNDTDYYLKLAQAPSSSSGMKTTTKHILKSLRWNNVQIMHTFERYFRGVHLWKKY